MKDRFKELRKDLGLSQTEFAERMGLTRSMINNIERGVVEPKEYLINLAHKTYGANKTWLETGEGEMYCPEMDDVLSLLSQKYQLDGRRMALIRAYLELPEEKQEAVLAYAEGVADCLRAVARAEAEDEERRYEAATGRAERPKGGTSSEAG